MKACVCRGVSLIGLNETAALGVVALKRRRAASARDPTEALDTILAAVLPAFVGGTVRYLPPPGWHGQDPAARHSSLTVVFPCYVPGATTAIRRLGAADALGRLLAEGLAMPRKLTVAGAAILLDTIDCASCWELIGGDLDAAAKQVMALTRAPMPNPADRALSTASLRAS